MNKIQLFHFHLLLNLSIPFLVVMLAVIIYVIYRIHKFNKNKK